MKRLPSSLTRLLAMSGVLALGIRCNEPNGQVEQTDLSNATLREHVFLQDMYGDEYFPAFLVDKCKTILVNMCHEIETANPKDLDVLYAITHRATERLNALQGEFEANDSEMETAAREALGMEFDFIAKAYGYEADVEELIAPREW